MSDTSATQATRMQHECNTSDTSETRATQVRHECYTNDTSATLTTRVPHEWKILIAAQVKTYFHTFIFTKLFREKSYIKKLYTRLELQMPLHVPI